MTKKRCLKIIDLLGILFVTFFVYNILSPIQSVCTLYADDLLSPFWPFFNLQLSNPLSIFLTSNHLSWVLSLFHCLTVRLLPIAFGIHPQVFVQTAFFPFACFIFTLYLYCVANNFNKYSKIKHLTFVWALLLFPLAISILCKSEFLWIFTQCCWFYAYVFVLLFGIIAFCEIQSFYVNKEHFSKKRLITFLILIFLIGGCFEFSKFILGSTLILGLLLDRIFTREPVTNKKTILFLVYSLFCCTYSLLVPTTIIHSDSYLKLFSFEELMNFLPSYLSEYWHYVIVDNCIFYILIAVLLLLIHTFGEDKLKNKRFYIYSVSTLLSVLLFNFAIIIGSNITYYSSILAHSGVRFCNTTMLLCLFLSCLGYFISNTEFKKPLLVGSFIILTLYGTYVKKEHFDFSMMLDSYKVIRQCHYVLDKFFVLHSLKTPVFYNYYTNDLFQNLSISYYIYFYNSKFKPTEYKIIDITDKSYSVPDKMHYIAIRDLMVNKCKEITGYQITDEELEKMDFQSLYQYKTN